MTNRERLDSVPASAVATWIFYMGGTPPYTTRSPTGETIGPRSTLLSISNGPEYFRRLWIRIVLRLFAQSSPFVCLPPEVLHDVVTLASLRS